MPRISISVRDFPYRACRRDRIKSGIRPRQAAASGFLEAKASTRRDDLPECCRWQGVRRRQGLRQKNAVSSSCLGGVSRPRLDPALLSGRVTQRWNGGPNGRFPAMAGRCCERGAGRARPAPLRLLRSRSGRARSHSSVQGTRPTGETGRRATGSSRCALQRKARDQEILGRKRSRASRATPFDPRAV
jgi:hypothetical protein